MFSDKNVLITGGTGSLGSSLLRRILAGKEGLPASIHVYSRDEDKQHRLRQQLQVEFPEQQDRVRFWLGDVRDADALEKVVANAHVILCLAALKQVPNCEFFPEEAVKTNVLGIQNLLRAIRVTGAPVETVVGISTDKACKPVNVMGMTKALQEKLLVQANLQLPKTRFVIARYGNVLGSRGSILPFFQEKIRRGENLTVTHPEMTRFLMTIPQAVDTVLATTRHAKAGETFVPRIPAGRIYDLAHAMIGDSGLQIEITGQRPGEKIHEILISTEESIRTREAHGYYIITPQFPELSGTSDPIKKEWFEYSSSDSLLEPEKIRQLLEGASI